MDTLEVLEKARELISDPKRWTQKWFARDAEGNEVYAADEEAVCWCSVGAVERFASHFSSEWNEAMDVLTDVSAQHLGPAGVNDRLGHEAALLMFDRAIAKLKERA